jgi:acyl carrier protein
VETIEQQLLSHIQEQFVSAARGELQIDTNLVDVIDSTAIMELVVWIEGTFGFTVELDDINPDNFGSVRKLGQWIRRSTEGKAA